MRLLAIAVLLSGCAHELDELSYACPENRECPDELICSAGQCVPPEPDRECFADFLDMCSSLGPRYECQELVPLTQTGFCTQSCASDAECNDDRKCSPAGICLRDCSTANNCDLGTTCTGVGGRPLCLPDASPKIGDVCREDSACELRGATARCAFPKSSLGTCLLYCTDDTACLADAEHPGRTCAGSPDLGTDKFCFETCDTTPCSRPDADDCKTAADGIKKICVPKPVKLPLGQLCVDAGECESKSCGRLSTTGMKRCVDDCIDDDSCGPGFECIVGSQASVGQCWPQHDGGDSGCSAAGGSGGMVWFGALALWTMRPRRRRSRA